MKMNASERAEIDERKRDLLAFRGILLVGRGLR
jgi:hypothetical protein